MTAAPKIDVNFVKPFIEGTVETLKVQCEMPIKVGRPYPKTDAKALKVDIAGLIGLTSTSFNGSIALCFRKQTFLNIMEAMLGEAFEEINEDVEDGAGELLNIIFGHAKRILNDKGYAIEKAIPSIISGDNINVQHLGKLPSVIVPFNSDAGVFYIEIALD